MDNPREAVIEDVLARILEEQGPETMALDWTILGDLVEPEEPEEESAKEDILVVATTI